MSAVKYEPTISVVAIYLFYYISIANVMANVSVDIVGELDSSFDMYGHYKRPSVHVRSFNTPSLFSLTRLITRRTFFGSSIDRVLGSSGRSPFSH